MERVQGRALKIRCKKCGDLIEVREEAADPAGGVTVAPTSAEAPGSRATVVTLKTTQLAYGPGIERVKLSLPEPSLVTVRATTTPTWGAPE